MIIRALDTGWIGAPVTHTKKKLET